jgi:hypothetical protein
LENHSRELTSFSVILYEEEAEYKPRFSVFWHSGRVEQAISTEATWNTFDLTKNNEKNGVAGDVFIDCGKWGNPAGIP